MHALLTLALLSSPLAAQTMPDSAAIFDLFTARCAAIIANPDAAVTAAFGQGNDAFGSVTSDKALLNYQEYQPLIDGMNATLFYTRLQIPAGREETCNLTVTDFMGDDPALNLIDMPDVIAGQAEALLGGTITRVGSPVMQNGEMGQMFLFSAGEGFPAPRSIYVIQAAGIVVLSYSIRIPN